MHAAGGPRVPGTRTNKKSDRFAPIDGARRKGLDSLFNSRLRPGSTGAGQDVRQGDRGNSQRKPDTNNRDGYDAVAHNGALQGLSPVERNQGHEECLGSDANPLRGKQQGLGTELSRTKDRGMPSRACVAAPTT